MYIYIYKYMYIYMHTPDRMHKLKGSETIKLYTYNTI